MKTKEDLIKAGPSIGIGLALGVVFGVLVDNIGLGISLGLVLGAAYSQTLGKK